MSLLYPTCFQFPVYTSNYDTRQLTPQNASCSPNTQPSQFSLENRPTTSCTPPRACNASARPSSASGDPLLHPCPWAQGLHFGSAWDSQCWPQRRSGSSWPEAALGGGRECTQHGQCPPQGGCSLTEPLLFLKGDNIYMPTTPSPHLYLPSQP